MEVNLKILSSFLEAIFLIIYHVTISIILAITPRQFRKKKNISGQNILITGAGSGVGRALAIEFSKYSVSLALVDINKKGLLQTEKLLDPRSTVHIYDCDVSDSKMVYKMAEKVKEDIGTINILVNNAGIVTGNYLLQLPDEKIKKTMEVNALSNFWTCKAFLPDMMKGNSGHIVFVASLAGKTGNVKLTDYCASKFAVIGFAESLEVELQEKDFDGIKVTIVNSTHITTGLFKGAKVSITPSVTPEFVAQEIVYGVQIDADTVFIPTYTGLLVALKEFAPRSLLIRIYKLTGLIHLMKNFTGRTPVISELNQ